MTALSFLSSSASIGSAIYPFALGSSTPRLLPIYSFARLTLTSSCVGAMASAGGVIILQPFLVALLCIMGTLWTGELTMLCSKRRLLDR